MATRFEINVPEESISLLKQKLELTRLPDELDEAGWDYGVPLSDIRRLVARWKDGYDWRKYEKELNDELPQFTRGIEVEGHGVLNVHYVYKESQAKGAIPLLFVHGWPGSFIEVRKILPLLTDVKEGQPSFHVVALGLPGYGFSEPAKKRGFDITKYAEVGHKLMLALGYNEYVTQGGDWGAIITNAMAAAYENKHLKAFHSNMPISRTPPADDDPSKYTPEERAGLERAQWFHRTGSGYYMEQSTQPQTIGYSLSDSPVGLLAWIYEKLVHWTDAYKWQDDEILTWISIYWFSRAGPAASVRIYYERAQKEGFAVAPPKTTAPYGASFFPKELTPVPLSWLSASKNVVFHARHEKGGHFAAYEVPELLVGDLRKMFGKGGPAYGVVSGKDGYA
ncbi:alpha/beta-hydrolase [Marasmius fiardii PR-910]|nr:alpha/beta-hydrolase [Marasmius fiardii PR-910]